MQPEIQDTRAYVPALFVVSRQLASRAIPPPGDRPLIHKIIYILHKTKHHTIDAAARMTVNVFTHQEDSI